MRALMVLEDGFWLEGKAFAGSGEAYGEVVFNTSMSGYQEIITDPSYKGQIVAFTYPLIGNYGANELDAESARPQVEAIIVREYSRFASNWRATRTLLDYLEANGVLGIEDVDTRALTRHVREAGAMRGVVSTTDLDRESLLRKVRSYPGLVGQDMVSRVTCSREYTWNTSGRYRVVALDFGIKRSILRMLESAGCQVTVVPAYTSAENILAKDPDGIFLSNGPGDPAGVPTVVREVAKLVGQKPIFGICLGHQILGLALGLTTFKLKYGHRGANHPVKNLLTGRVEITSQNHGFCVQAPASSICETPEISLAAAAATGAAPRVASLPNQPGAACTSGASGAPAVPRRPGGPAVPIVPGVTEVPVPPGVQCMLVTPGVPFPPLIPGVLGRGPTVLPASERRAPATWRGAAAGYGNATAGRGSAGCAGTAVCSGTAECAGSTWCQGTVGRAITAGPAGTLARTGTADLADGAGAPEPEASRGAGRAALPVQVNQATPHPLLEGSRATLCITHVNLNDGTVEGMEVPELLCFSVQYHPEASPGPHDSRYLFEKFVSMMQGNHAGGGQVASPAVGRRAARTAADQTTGEAMG